RLGLRHRRRQFLQPLQQYVLDASQALIQRTHFFWLLRRLFVDRKETALLGPFRRQLFLGLGAYLLHGRSELVGFRHLVIGCHFAFSKQWRIASTSPSIFCWRASTSTFNP